MIDNNFQLENSEDLQGDPTHGVSVDRFSRHDVKKTLDIVSCEHRLKMALETIREVLNGEKNPEDARRALLCAGMACVKTEEDSNDTANFLINITIGRLEDASDDAVCDLREQAEDDRLRRERRRKKREAAERKTLAQHSEG